MRLQWNLPWQCLLRGHGLVRYKDGPVVAMVTFPDGSTSVDRKSWSRRICDRCRDIPVEAPW